MKCKAFTLLELLVVIAILGVFTVIAYPNVTKWITDREVKKEVYDFVAEINEMKSKVSNGEYALAMVNFTTPNFQYAYMKKYYAETGRDESYVTTKLGGTSEYDINPNFNPDGYTNLVNISPSELRENLQNMSPERAEELGLEIQALREVSSNEKMFNGLFQDFRESSPLELDNQLGKMDQMDITAQPSVLKDEITPPLTEPSLSYAAPSA